MSSAPLDVEAAAIGREHVYLQPGQLHAAARPTTITTILASCVAVCLYDAGRGYGGMNHFLLPQVIETEGVPARYGALATRLLIERLRELGSRPADLEAKVFGGASVLDALIRPGRPSLGDQNSECAFRVLAEARIPVVASDVGGRRSRKVVFHTEVGTAAIRWL